MRKIEHYRGKTNREKFNKLPIFAIDEKGKPLVTEKEYSWLYDYANQLQTKMQELEEDNKNLQALSKINREEHMRIHEQNKRYRELLEKTHRLAGIKKEIDYDLWKMIDTELEESE